MEINETLFHLGENNEEYFNASTPPLIQSNNFLYKNVKEMQHALQHEDQVPFYTRGSNPTTDILRKKMAALEKTEDSLIFSSGSAAISAAIMSNVAQGDHVVCVQKPYSWTGKLLNNTLAKFGVETTFVDGKVIDEFKQATRPNTKIIFLESPNSWTFEMQDIEPIVAYAKEMGILTIMDNSYATPLNLNPADYGVDLIAHSSSKYIGGHSDAISGILCGSREMILKIFRSDFMTLGGVVSPFNSWLLLRGLRTLPIRMKRVSETTPPIVDYLEQHPKIKSVYYPHAKSHDQHNLAVKYLKNPAGQFSAEVNTESPEDMERFCNALKYFKLGCSWGGYESLAFPALTLFDSQNYSQATTPFNMIRFYVGLEDEDVLVKDLEQALQYV